MHTLFRLIIANINHNTIGSLLPDGHEIEDSCKSMESLPLNQYPRLVMLSLIDCDSLRSLQFDYCPNLGVLSLERCDNLEAFVFSQEVEVQSSSKESRFGK